ncbi:MAG: DUF2162 domain-containing protein [Methanosphaera sp.]|nr:DUF2162 domain-containing protein [Methanosphaera sp.]
MFEEFLQYGILLAVLIFGVKIGLALGFSGIKRKTAIYILVGYGIGLILLSYICQPFTDQIYQIVYGYSSAIFAVIAVIILATGFKTIYDWKVTGKNSGSATCMAMVAPCPCCFGAILASVIMIAPVAGVSTVALGSLSSVALVIVMGITYFLSTQIVSRIDKPYPIVLGNFMVFMGLYFLLCILILPNMVYVSEGSSISLASLSGTLSVVVGGIILMVVGAVMARKTSSFLNY